MQNKNDLSLQEPKLPEQLANARRNHGGMTVPEDFFSQFERKMNAVIDAAEEVQKAETAPVVQMRPAVVRPRRIVQIAATVAIVAGIGIIYHASKFGLSQTDVPATIESLAENQASSESEMELPEQVAEEMMASTSDYDVFDLYCDL